MCYIENRAEVGTRTLKQDASASSLPASAGQAIAMTNRGRPVAQSTAIPAWHETWRTPSCCLPGRSYQIELAPDRSSRPAIAGTPEPPCVHRTVNPLGTSA